MNYQMNPSACLVMAVLLVGTAFPHELPAQDSPVLVFQSEQPDQHSSPEAQASWTKRLPEIGFDDMDLSKVLNLLRDEFPGVNLVVSGPAEKVSVTLQLRNVGLREILDALEIATDAHVRFKVTNQDKLVAAIVQTRVSGRPYNKPVLKAFSLHRYLEGKSQEESAEALARLEQTLESAWMMLAESEAGGAAPERPRLSIHRNTKILLAVGHPDQLAAIEEIINALQGSVPMPPRDDEGNSR